MIFGKIVPRLLLGFLLLSPLPLATLTWFATRAFERSLQTQQITSLSAIADKKVEQINTYLYSRISDGQTLSKLRLTHEIVQGHFPLHAQGRTAGASYKEKQQAFRAYISGFQENMHFYDLLLIDASGAILFSVAQPSTNGKNVNSLGVHDNRLAIAHQNAIALLQTQNTQAFPYDFSEGKRAIFVVAPIIIGGKAAGSLALQLDLEKLTAVTSDNTGLGTTGETVIAQREGDQVLYVGALRHIPDAAFRYRATLESRPPPMKAALLGDHGSGITYDYAGVGVLSAWRHLPALGWGMVVKQDSAEVFAPIHAFRNYSLVGLGLLLLVSGGIALVLGRSLVLPIQNLVAVTGRLARGDLSQRSANEGMIEFRQLGVAFNSMAERLQASHLDLEKQVNERTFELTQAQTALQQINIDLEQRVNERTVELVAAKDAAEAANHTKNEFLASMSHELRTPLNAILGFAQLLSLDPQLSEDTHQQAREIERAGDHLLSLLSDLLDLARIESGRIELSMESVLVKTIIDDSLAMVEPIAKKYDVALINENATTSGTTVYADHVRLRQVVINLLSNAIKYNRKNGTVRLCCGITDNRVRISIVDAGRGIAADKQARIFIPFDRLGEERGTVEGTGIGLVISKRIVNAMEGDIGFASVEGMGSTFWIEFSVAESTRALLTEKPAPVAVVQHLHCPLVLYIEDNPLNLRLMRQIFAKRNDLKLRDAHTAELGIDIARAEHPALILMDINLPGMDGYAALKILKIDASTVHIPVVALTANAMKGDKERGLTAGFAAYLTKPIDVAAVYAVLDEYIAGSPSP
ncbi:MAG: ATP-binding protein [Pseudomonadota bacterium]